MIRMQSTIQLFRHLYNALPPLFPDDIKQKMAHALTHLEGDQTISLDEIEDTMITFGYEVWPWNQAYREFLAVAESLMGEHFLLPKLSRGLQDKYQEFKKYGGTFRELHSGNPAHFFTSEERNELCVALVEIQSELREYTDHEVKGVSKVKYLRRVNEFKDILDEMKGYLGHLKQLAEQEQDHPTLADEIRSMVKHFEYGMCLLGPDLDYKAVCESVEFFRGRKQELNRMKGMHVPLKMDFFNT